MEEMNMLSEIASFCSGILASVLANELGDLTHNKVDDKKKQKLEIKTLDNIEKQVKDLFEQEHVREWLFEQQYEIEQVGCLFSEEEKELKPDLSGTIGEGKLLFRASESPWSREKDADGKDKPNKVTDGPYLFRTGTGRLGMIWTSWIYNVYTQGVAYSESGTLDGPWIQEKDPITPPNFGHGMLFQTLDGKWLMSVHSHKDVNGRYIRTPRLFEVDFSGDKLVVGKPYIP